MESKRPAGERRRASVGQPAFRRALFSWHGLRCLGLFFVIYFIGQYIGSLLGWRRPGCRVVLIATYSLSIVSFLTCTSLRMQRIEKEMTAGRS